MTISARHARQNLERLIARVNQDHSVVEIASEHGAAILMSKKEYDALAETGYLLKSPRNAERLLSSLKAAREQ